MPELLWEGKRGGIRNRGQGRACGWAVQEGRASGKSSQTTRGLQASDLGREPPPHLSYWEELAENASDVSWSLEVRGQLRSACDVPECGLRGLVS